MGLLTGATAEAMLRATGGETITNGGESSWCHFERVPIETGEDAGGYGGGILSTTPSAVIAEDRFTNIGPRKGIGQEVLIDGTDTWEIYDIVPADPDGGTIRLLLKTAD